MSFSSLESLVGNLERRPQWQSHQKFQYILECWPQVVGDVVAVQTRPLSIQRNVLSVSTSTPVWSQNLAFQRHHILQKLSVYVPDHHLKDIRFSPAKWLDIRKASKSCSSSSGGGSISAKRSLKRYHFDESEARSLWSYHPCNVAPSSQRARDNLDNSGKVRNSKDHRKELQQKQAQLTSPADMGSSPEPSAFSPGGPVAPNHGPELALTSTPVQTFHDWAARVQKRSQRLPKCPRCHSPTPIGELQRWSVCSLCVSQDW